MRPSTGPTRPLLALALAAATAVLAACGGAPAAANADGLPTTAPNAADVVEGQFYRPTTLRFASISGADEESSADRYAPLVAYLGEQLGMETEFIETTDYSSVIEGMRAGRVDLAVYGPFSFVIASTEANAVPLVAAPNQDTGQLGYKSLIITGATSGLDSIAELQGRSMAFADPASTSGNLFPRLILANEGITDVEGYFSETSFSGGHDASLVAVANGQVDAAGVCDTCIERFFAAGLADPADIRTIAESETIPPSPVSARGDLDPALRERITEIYLAMQTSAPEIMQQASDLDGPPAHPYVAVQDADYDVIRDLAETLDVDLAELG
jgi:phosphonate transport system substrate-binding protein